MTSTLDLDQPGSARWLAFDIGGANLKAAHSSGPASTLPFEVWKRPGELADGLAELASTLPPAEGWAVTMTAELCDCYPTKAAGVRSILEATQRASGGRPVQVWGTDGQFHAVAAIFDQPRLAAASNWLALGSVVARNFGDSGLLLDVGSTTSDLIPWARGEVAVPVEARTDLGRLQSGALVYAGVRRTPLCALGPTLPYRGVPTATMAELFASTLDVYLTLGRIPDDSFERATADGGPMTVDAARDRLARMVGLDRDEFTADDALALAEAADEVLVDRLVESSQRVTQKAIGGAPATVVVAGSGEFLAWKVAGRVVAPGGSIVSLAQTWGLEASAAACAHALVQLVQGVDP